jgi:malate synthase
MSWLESALTPIQDCEDSVAAVDAEDKVDVYSQLARPDEGRPEEEVDQGRQDIDPQAQSRPRNTTRRTARELRAGRSLMLVRNVGHLMTNPAILDKDGNEVPEGIMDAAW